MLRKVDATRYVKPLREGGSLPAIMEADDYGLYVVKFRGAAQGPKALIAELIAGEIGRALGLLVPEIVFVEVDQALSRSEPHAEIQALVKASSGLNLGLDFLSESLAFDPLSKPVPDPTLAAAVVWFDAFVTNVDRTARNTNMLVWHKRLWLIDHGAALYFHHTWTNYLERSLSPFSSIKEHVLLPFTNPGAITEADENLKSRLNAALFEEIINAIPEDWLDPEVGFATPDEHRAAYLAYLNRRLEASAVFVEEAINARAQLV